MSDKDDHDLLIEISTKLSLYHELFVKHVEEDAKHFTIIDTKLNAAHRRMDWLVGGIGFTVLVTFIVGIIKVAYHL